MAQSGVVEPFASQRFRETGPFREIERKTIGNAIAAKQKNKKKKKLPKVFDSQISGLGFVVSAQGKVARRVQGLALRA